MLSVPKADSTNCILLFQIWLLLSQKEYNKNENKKQLKVVNGDHISIS